MTDALLGDVMEEKGITNEGKMSQRVVFKIIKQSKTAKGLKFISCTPGERGSSQQESVAGK